MAPATAASITRGHMAEDGRPVQTSTPTPPARTYAAVTRSAKPRLTDAVGRASRTCIAAAGSSAKQSACTSARASSPERSAAIADAKAAAPASVANHRARNPRCSSPRRRRNSAPATAQTSVRPTQTRLSPSPPAQPSTAPTTAAPTLSGASERLVRRESGVSRSVAAPAKARSTVVATSLRPQDDSRSRFRCDMSWDSRNDVGQQHSGWEDQEDQEARCDRLGYETDLAREQGPRPSSGGEAERRPEKKPDGRKRCRLPSDRRDHLAPVEAKRFQDRQVASAPAGCHEQHRESEWNLLEATQVDDIGRHGWRRVGESPLVPRERSLPIGARHKAKLDQRATVLGYLGVDLPQCSKRDRAPLSELGRCLSTDDTAADYSHWDPVVLRAQLPHLDHVLELNIKRIEGLRAEEDLARPGGSATLDHRRGDGAL